MARPFWLRLFGRNADITIDQVREAVLSSDFGARIADSSNFLQQILRISDRVEASGPRAALVTADPGALVPVDLDAARGADAGGGAQPSPATAILTGPELWAIADAASPGPANLEDGGDDRLFRLQIGTVQPLISTGTRAHVEGVELSDKEIEDLVFAGWAANYLRMDVHPLLPIVEYDAITVASMADVESRGSVFDTLALSGDFSAGFDLPAPPADLGQILLAAGNDYVLAVGDDFQVGGSVTIDGRSLGAGNHVMFDGSAETDGSFSFQGSGGNDLFLGGAGADSIHGLGGGDVLSGGAGADTFVYTGASESTGTTYDLLADFDPAVDRIDLPGSVSGFAAAVTSGSLSDATFNVDLTAALGGLGAHQAAWFAPDAGDLAGQIFLVVDGNGVAGYQVGEDYVFGIAGSPLPDLIGHTDFFI
ncbi:MAG: large repetitive protein [Sphingomonadales bacterium]|nr:large repetitive protein [Sphingomonadales bacterium]